MVIGIKVRFGDEVHLDIIIAAMGLKLLIAWSTKSGIGSSPFNVQEQLLWSGLVFEGLPNLIFRVSYFGSTIEL
jgi:hypothetical protein